MNRPSSPPSDYLAAVDDHLETAEDHPLQVERHVRRRLHAAILPDLCHAFVPRLLRGPDEPGEDDPFALLRVDGAVEIGDLAVRHVVAPAFDQALRAMFEEELAALGRHLAI